MVEVKQSIENKDDYRKIQVALMSRICVCIKTIEKVLCVLPYNFVGDKFKSSPFILCSLKQIFVQ